MVPATEFVKKLFDDRSVYTSYEVDVETVTSLTTSLGVHKATGVDGLSV